MNNVMSSGRGWGEGQVGVEANSRQTLPRDSSPKAAAEIPSGSYTANCSLGQQWDTLPLLSLTWGLQMGTLVRPREGERAETTAGPGPASPHKWASLQGSVSLFLLWSWGERKGEAPAPAPGCWNGHNPYHLSSRPGPSQQPPGRSFGEISSYLGGSHFLHSDPWSLQLVRGKIFPLRTPETESHY